MNKSVSSEEYEVHVCVLRNTRAFKERGLFVFHEGTSSERLKLLEQLTITDKRQKRQAQLDVLDAICSSFPAGIGKATAQDFVAKNEAGGVLEPKFPFAESQIALPEGEKEVLWGKGREESGWDVFYQKYPNAPGYFSFSRVGFNSNHTEALVEVSFTSGRYRGRGMLIQLRKGTDGKWAPHKDRLLWAS